MAMWDASVQNHVAYIDQATGLFAEKFLEQRSCPACGSEDHRFMFHKSGGSYAACNECRMAFLNPVFKDDVLENYYRNNHQLQGETVSADIEFYAKLYNKGLDQIVARTGRAGRILDVGCSTGSFLDIAAKAGWESHGLELNHTEAQIAKGKGHAVQESMLANARFDLKFDAITLWDVFEHIKDNLSFLSEARRFLAPGGVIFIQSPSCDALAARVLQVQCNMFDGLEHVNLHGVQSLSRLCDRAGYELASFETVIAEIGVINNYLAYENPYLGYGGNSQDVLGIIDEAWIHANKLGYKFQTCLRPK
jgi:2-polyprenyl-3-methyl-5-hydroxy-6-metoxy-1,4-benzoquinol methylase